MLKLQLFKINTKEISAEEEISIIKQFMDKITSSVEIVNKDKKSLLSQFVKTPETFFLTQYTRDQFFQVVDIESPSNLLD